MSRQLRVQYPGAIYHMMNRGDHSEEIFQDDCDRQRFLSTLAEACEKTSSSLLKPEEPMECYRWSRYPLYISEGVRPSWLRVDRLPGERRIEWCKPGAAEQFRRVMEARRQA